MAYATVAHVAALNSARTFTANTQPSVEDCLLFLEDVKVEIDGVLRGHGYELPIATTATDALRLLQSYNAKGAWALCERAAPASPHRESAQKEWNENLSALKTGKVELDAPRTSGEGGERAVRFKAAEATSLFYRDMEL